MTTQRLGHGDVGGSFQQTAVWMCRWASLRCSIEVSCAANPGGRPAGWRAGFSDLDPRPVGGAHSSGAAPEAIVSGQSPGDVESG